MLRVDFPYADKDGKQIGVNFRYFEFPDEAVYVTGIEVQAVTPFENGNGSTLVPIIVMPFSTHDDSRRLHTICRRIPDPTIDEYPV